MLKPGSVWQSGPDWMYEEVQNMPIKLYAELCSEMSQQEFETVDKEVHPSVIGVNTFRHPILNELSECFCVQDHDLLPTEEKVCTEKCKILKSDTSGLEAACPSINIVKPSSYLSVVNSVNERDLGAIFVALASKESKVEGPYPVDFVRLGFR